MNTEIIFQNPKMKICNMKTYPVFKLVDPPEYKSTVNIKSVQLQRVSHDAVYEELKKQGKQIDIINPEFLNNNKRTLNGIFSPLFGPDMMQESQMYTCECHRSIGAAKEGKVCPECGTVVKSIDTDLRIMGHIDIAPFHILSFHGMVALKKCIPNLEELFKYNKKIDIKGKLVVDDKMSIIDIYENYEDIFEPITHIPIDIAFMSKIPVYSARLRPFIKNGINVTMLDVNKRYQSIVILSEDLKSTARIHSSIQIIRTLNQIQNDFIAINEHVDSQIGSKSGIIRKFMASGRVDYSSRMVIALDETLKPDEVDIPYQTAMVIYEEEIINRLARIDDISRAHALSNFKLSINVRDEKFVKIIEMILKETKDHKGIWALINRNPTINETGVLYVKVRRINEDIRDLTLKLPPDILTPLGADFDGDQLTFAAVKDARFHELFKMVFSPTNHMLDRATGYFNRGMGWKKDYAAILSAVWDLGTKINDYLLCPDDITVENLKDIGIDYFDESAESTDDIELISQIMKK